MSQAEGKMTIRKTHFWKVFKKMPPYFHSWPAFHINHPKLGRWISMLLNLLQYLYQATFSQIDGRHKSEFTSNALNFYEKKLKSLPLLIFLLSFWHPFSVSLHGSSYPDPSLNIRVLNGPCLLIVHIFLFTIFLSIGMALKILCKVLRLPSPSSLLLLPCFKVLSFFFLGLSL